MKDPSLHDPSPYFKGQVPDYKTPNYEDPTFKPDEFSINYIDRSNSITKSIDECDTNSLKGLIWCRPEEIFKGQKYHVFEDTIFINFKIITNRSHYNCRFPFIR